MPIRLPSTLPAFDVLRDEGVMVMGRIAATGRTSARCASGF
jgi:homoserine O-succinyltransferase